MLYAMGLCEWQNYKDVEPKDILNMEKDGADTITHHKKVLIADKIADWARREKQYA
jgi:hypothetical protein